MIEWLRQSLSTPVVTPALLAASLALGFIGALSCSACHFTVLGAIAGYSGTACVGAERKRILLNGLSFMLGVMAALSVLGATAGFIGQAAGASLGAYWRVLAGFILVAFGLANLGLLPVKLAPVSLAARLTPSGGAGAMVYGLAVGGGVSACSALCNPVLPIVLGVAAVPGKLLWGIAVLAMFGLGYSLPLTLGLVGIGFGFRRLAAFIREYTPAILTAAGVLLVGVGFLILAGA
jgi:cytochrome c biogenesis protein CcdA